MIVTLFNINPWEFIKGVSEWAWATVWYLFIKPLWWFWLMLIVFFVVRIFFENKIFNWKNKKCPHCAEYIKREAKTCRYCGKDV